jgi:hypothetical protein
VRERYEKRRRVYFSSLADPVRQLVYLIDEHRRLVYDSFLLVPPAGELQMPFDAEVADIEGLRCFKLPTPDFDEMWVSVELQHPVLERKGRAIWRMYEIRMGEPAPSEFELPL